MRIVILTGHRRGAASDFLPVLAGHPGIDVAMVVLSERQPRSRAARWKRKLRKTRKIGLGGALVGLYLRTWNDESSSELLPDAAQRLGVPFETTPRFNCARTRELFRASGARLGLALGTAVLGPKLFSTPELGMINVHGAVLPRFRGGMSVIWEVYEGVREIGFSIHRIDRGIDTGPLLHVERFPLVLERTLRETYRTNVREIRQRVPAPLAEVVADFEQRVATAQVLSGGTTYTTPTLLQFLRMRRNHRRMLRESSIEGDGRTSRRPGRG